MIAARRAPALTAASRIACAIALGLASAAVAGRGIDLQGHRGARGIAPENTLEGVARALAIGVSTLELDLVMSADGALMVNHDPRLNPAIVRGPDGRWLSPPTPAVIDLTRAALAAFDVGRIDPRSRYAARFPDQTPIDGARIPALAEVFALLERSGASGVRLSLETKLDPARPAESPSPEVFADAVVDAIRGAGFEARASVQSFDWRTLARVQARAPSIETVYLSVEQRWLDTIRRGQPGPSPWTAGLDVDAFDGSVARMVAAAGGRIWAPHFRELDAQALAGARALGLRVLVWTVNAPADIRRLALMGVDGLITDYPDRARAALAALGFALPSPLPPAR